MPEKTTVIFAFFLLVLNIFPHSVHSQHGNYPLVHEEYFHQPIFENEQIRVLNVSAAKGDTTELHRHCNPILYLTLEGATVGLKEPSKSWKSVDLKEGWIGHDIYNSDSCFVHQFAVLGERSLHIVAIEALLISEPPVFSFEPIFSQEGFKLYQISSVHLPELKSYTTPIILVESLLENESRVEVIGSDQVTKEILKLRDAYAVFYCK